MARISACMLAFSLFIATSAADQGGFPALLAEPGAAEHHDELMLFGRFVGAWQFKSVEYRLTEAALRRKAHPAFSPHRNAAAALIQQMNGDYKVDEIYMRPSDFSRMK